MLDLGGSQGGGGGSEESEAFRVGCIALLFSAQRPLRAVPCLPRSAQTWSVSIGSYGSSCRVGTNGSRLRAFV